MILDEQQFIFTAATVAGGMVTGHLVDVINNPKIDGSSAVADFIRFNQATFKNVGLNIQVSPLSGSGDITNIHINGKKVY